MKRILPLLSVLALVLSGCVWPFGAAGGIVQGVVYADLNGNGTIEAGEGPLDGVTVQLDGCGPTQSQVTGADGAFNFSGLPAGSCTVQVSKAGWIFSGSFPSLGYPVPVASDPDLPTAFSMFMAPVSDALPTDTPGAGDATATPTPSETPVSATATVAFTSTPSTPMVAALDADVNCRFGPSTGYLSVGALVAGNWVPITGRLADSSWWQIQNPLGPGTYCWVAGGVAQTAGNPGLAPVLLPPVGLVIEVSVTVETFYTACGGPNPSDFHGFITTNGPTTVTFHWEITGDKTNTTSDEEIIFAAAGTQEVFPGAYSADCGEYRVTLVITSPNSVSAFQDYTIPP